MVSRNLRSLMLGKDVKNNSTRREEMVVNITLKKMKGGKGGTEKQLPPLPSSLLPSTPIFALPSSLAKSSNFELWRWTGAE